MHADSFVKRHRAAALQRLNAREPALINLPIPIPSDIPILSPIIDTLVAGIPLTKLFDPSATLPPLISLPTLSIPLPTLSIPLPTLSIPIPTLSIPLLTFPTTSAEAPPTSTSPVSTSTPVATVPVVTNLPSVAPTPQPTSSPHAPDTPTPKPPAATPEPQSPGTPASTPVQTQPSTPNMNNGGGNNTQNSSGGSSNNGDSGNHPTSPASAGSDAPPTGHTSLAASPTASVPSGETGASSSVSSFAGASSAGTGISLLPTATVLDGTTIVSVTLTDGQAIPVPTQKAVANAGSVPASGSSIAAHFTATSSTITYSAAGSLSTGASGGAGDGNSGDGSDGGQDGGKGSGAGAGNSAHHGLSTAVIAVLAVVGALLLLALIVFSCRRCSIAKRLSRRRRWYGGKSIYGAVSSSGYFRQNPSPSVRSSFGTTYEHNADPFSMDPVPLTRDWPLYHSPEMSQSSSMSVAAPSTAATIHSLPSPTLRNGDRSSVASYDSALTVPHSDESGTHEGQVLLVPAHMAATGGPLTPDLPTPLSVRPFSPSERWSFPKPPTLTSAGYSGVVAFQPPRRTISTSPASLTTYFTAPEAENPFGDAAAVDSADGHATAETFVTVDTDAAAHFRATETVRRAYVPVRADELALAPGESVRVMRRFDDGWAYAENLSSGSRGLFPIDCLRMADQDLDTFLAEKRLGAYAGVRPPSAVLVHNMI